MACLVLALSACAGFKLVKGGQRQDLGAGLSVEPGRDWNRVVVEKYEYWTLDGIQLQNIVFVKGANDGESIVYRGRAAGDETDTFPKYRKGMTLIEIRELIETTWARRGYHRFRVTEFGTAPFGDKAGFQIAFAFDTRDGLEMQGQAVGAIVAARLYLAIYTGTRIHFYARGERDFGRIVKSLRFSPKPSS
jgi:hypothetical protein